ncbi:MAG: C40 family peptidase [Clostridia bacterium]|nr:C40 family peptidase [Clostridia bacterium]
MIQADEAIAVGRRMLGTPYATYDCINFIKAILRQAEGGEKKYQTAGTNSLWRSKDLAERWENLDSPRPGMLAFKASGSDVHHVGLVTGKDTVLHSSSAKGCVVETNLMNGQWHYLARHRLIALGGDEMTETDKSLCRAMVTTEHGGLRMRRSPETGVVLLTIPKGEAVDILKDGEWPKVAYRGMTGYVKGSYLVRQPDAEAEKCQPVADSGDDRTTLISLADNSMIVLHGRWRVAED